MSNNVCAITNSAQYNYPTQCPYDPSSLYPEYAGSNYSDETNNVYDAIRNLFIDLKMDEDNVGKDSWNPFKDLVMPGNVVVIKPNLVYNPPNANRQTCTTTHASVIRPIIDYVWKALKSKGTIIIGDACAAETDFQEVIMRSNIDKMVSVLVERGLNIKIEDFRSVKVHEENGIWIGEQKDLAKENGVIVNLAKESMFYGTAKNKKFHGAGYNIKETTKHHKGDIQEYSVSKTILEADVIISVPKFKTHRKAGITCCLKNLVGINTDKNYLPHFTMGSENMGGDEMPTISSNRILGLRMYDWFREYILAYTWKTIGGIGSKILKIAFHNTKKTAEEVKTKDLNTTDEVDNAGLLHTKITGQSISSGAWQGNLTICKMILDLNKIFLCCDKNGKYTGKTNRKYFYVVDGIELGMGDGPINPIPLHSGFVAAGYNGFKIDYSLISLFGINPNVIPLYNMASSNNWIVSNGIVLFNGNGLTKNDKFICGELVAPKGWRFYDK